jgi:hypothetical protein
MHVPQGAMHAKARYLPAMKVSRPRPAPYHSHIPRVHNANTHLKLLWRLKRMGALMESTTSTYLTSQWNTNFNDESSSRT